MSIDLKPCPFCGGTDFAIVENGRVWAGMKHSEPTSVSVRHWCPATPGQPSRMIERVGRDEDGAIAAWNTRAILALRPVQGEPVTVAVDHFDNGPYETYTNRIYPSVEIGTKLYTTPKPAQATQAEAQQPVTGEPVWFHKHWGDDDDIFYRPDDKIPPGSTPLYTHSAPSVPADVVRDAERYRWLRKHGGYNPPRFGDSDGYSEFEAFFWTHSETLDAAIDAAMLAAK